MAATVIHNWNVPYAGKDRWLLRLLPSLTDLAFFLPLVLLFCLPQGLNGLLGDADTGWHIKTGEWILQHGAVPKTDIFSFTKAGQPWFAWEWGWDVLFAQLHTAFGLGGVLFVNIVILCLISALLYRSVRRACDCDLLALVITTVGLLASAVHWWARPHLLSWLFFLVLIEVLTRAEAGQTYLLRWLPLLLLLWTNMHGSFPAGIVMIVISGIGQALDALLQPVADWRRAWYNSRAFCWTAAGCAAITFLNPYGWRVHAHIFTYLRDSELLDMIQEFASVSFHSPYGAVLGYLILLGAGSVLWCLQRRRWSLALGIAVWAHAALVSARNVPLFVFVACPAIAAMLASAAPYLRSLSITERLARAVSFVNRELLPFERVERLHLATVLGLILLAYCMTSGQPQYTARFAADFPASAIPVIERTHASRIFAVDQWGDYLLYRLYPRIHVYADGRSDFYGKTFLQRCNHIINARWDWEADLSKNVVDMVLIRPDMPLATVLKSSPHWHVLFDDGKAIVFSKVFSGAVEPPRAVLPPQQISSVARNRGRELGAVWLASAEH